ncbi:hypothetical protein D3C73_1369170 [compost metagenome]
MAAVHDKFRQAKAQVNLTARKLNTVIGPLAYCYFVVMQRTLDLFQIILQG